MSTGNNTTGRMALSGLKPPTQVKHTVNIPKPVPPPTKEDAKEQTAPSASASATTKPKPKPRAGTSTTTTAKKPITSTTSTSNKSLKRKAESNEPVVRNTRAKIETKPSTITTSARRTVTARSTSSTTSAKPKPATSKPASKPAETKEDGPIVKKRPAWDTKGRLEDMEVLTGYLKDKLGANEERMGDLATKLNENESEIDKLKKAKESLETEVSTKEKENVTISREVDELKYELETTKRKFESELDHMKTQHQREKEQFEHDKSLHLKNIDRLTSDLDAAQTENSSLKNTVATQSANSLALEADNSALKMKLQKTEETLREREETISTLEQQLKDAQQLISELESKVREEESIRRRLHNTIQELKGNIRVFCRVRPPLGSELSNTTTEQVMTHLDFGSDEDEKTIELNQTGESASGNAISKNYPFAFDKVFAPKSTQSDVFGEISQLVQSALDGYNVCIFAYGQTGSGKTYTMEGPDDFLDNPDEMGMIPRAVFQIFETAQKLEEKGWKYEIEGQFLEIYNETIRDLLSSSSASAENKKHDIKHDAKTGKTTVTDITLVPLEGASKVTALLKKANQNRAVGATNSNERSSRSHSVFTLRLKGVNSITEETSDGLLNLIDLAGSERLAQSGSTGDRLKETQAINKSLSCLGDVIFALANKDQHIPYRNSKLTYLLQNSLGGNSKTLMFVNVSPLSTNFNETLNSLRFATKVNNCQIGTATAKKK